MSAAEPLLGVAALARMSFSGVDLAPLSMHMLDRIERDPMDANALLDLSVLLQLLGKPSMAKVMQERALAVRSVYHLDAPRGVTDVRLLALMTSGDLMSNAPIDFLLEDSGVSLDMVFVTPEIPLPVELPSHDLAFVAVADSDDNLPVLRDLASRLERWEKPVLNRPGGIIRTTREETYETLKDVAGIQVPASLRVSRAQLEELCIGAEISAVLEDFDASGKFPSDTFPAIVRPTNSHAGHGLERIEVSSGLAAYLARRAEKEFYLSPFVDYRSADGLFRKYRIVLIDGKAYASHMAISSNWMVHYLNAGMSESEEKREEEARFMAAFDEEVGRRHRASFDEMYRRFGLDYLVIDCAETQDGRLLVFEVDAGAVVHAMDPVDLFPYKHVQMRKVFDAFHAMLQNRCSRDRKG